MKREEWVEGAGPGATLEIPVVQPVVKHSVSVQQVLRWLEGVTTSPKEMVKKEKLQELLGAVRVRPQPTSTFSPAVSP